MLKEPDLDVSNGTCYFQTGSKSGGDMIPCGNDYFGDVPCCQAGDKCLESNVCYNEAYDVTYVAGCTDETYQATSCPYKYDDVSTPWMGLAYCNGSSNQWVLCDQPEHPKALTSPDPCYCPTATTDRSMILSQGPTIANVAILPITEGGKISWFNGMSQSTTERTGELTETPVSSDSFSTTFVSSTILTPGPTTVAGGTPFTSAVNTNAALANKQGFNEPAKIGTAVSATIGGLIALGALGYYILRHLRQKRFRQQEKQREEEEAIAAFMSGGNDKTPGGGSNNNNNHNYVDPRNIGIAVGVPDHEVSRFSNPDTAAVSELDSIPARPWSTRSELDSVTTATVRSPSDLSAMAAAQGQAHPQAQGHEHVTAGPSELGSQPLAELPG